MTALSATPKSRYLLLEMHGVFINVTSTAIATASVAYWSIGLLVHLSIGYW